MVDYAEYERRLNAAVSPFLMAPVGESSIVGIRCAVTAAQADFIFEHPDYVALGDVSIEDYGNGRLDIQAPICTITEKMRIDYEAAQRAKALEALDEELKAEDVRRQRAYYTMLKRHAKLMERHSAAIPPSTSKIWHTLNEWQQYAILKDIDYEFRHRS